MRGKSQPNGTETVSQNGYKYTKVDGVWRLTHHLVAEEHILKRPLLPHESVRFRSNDKMNLHPNNLQVVVRGKGSLRKREAQLEERIRELQGQLDQVRAELAKHDSA